MKSSLAIMFFIIGTLVMMILYADELLLFGIMGIASAGLLAVDKWKNLRAFLIAMFVGGICENLAVFLGAWSYSNANYLFAPLWLPLGWGMAVVLLEEAFSKDIRVGFSKRAVVMAFGGTAATGMLFENEFAVMAAFALITIGLFFFRYYKNSEIFMGLMAAVFGTAMESSCIIAGNWQYSAAMLGTPLWLPLCWFNAFLIMRRIIRFGEES
jgi:uncharacterized membrane protein YoaT (DUF817 family)